GTMALTLPDSVYLGFVVSSHNTGAATTAVFHDFGPVTGVGPQRALAFEGLGQCSRRTSLVLSEIMYHPTNSSLEFVELFNSRGEPQDLSGYQLGGSVSFTFPAGSQIDGGGFVVVAGSPANFQSAYGLSNVFGPFSGHLPNDNGTVELISQSGGVLLE